MPFTAVIRAMILIVLLVISVFVGVRMLEALARENRRRLDGQAFMLSHLITYTLAGLFVNNGMIPGLSRMLVSQLPLLPMTGAKVSLAIASVCFGIEGILLALRLSVILRQAHPSAQARSVIDAQP